MERGPTGQRTSPDEAPSEQSGWRRRDVLIGAGGVALGAGIFAALPPPRSGTIVSDARFAASRAFGRDAARDGRRVVWIEGDVTAAYNEIDLLWRRAKVAVSGFTAYGAFFCLERLAMDRGLRVAAKREHREETLLIAWTIAPRSRGGVA